jgi:hypothetical protein
MKTFANGLVKVSGAAKVVEVGIDTIVVVKE